MTIKTTLKILMCSSALVFTSVNTASAHQHKSGEAAADHMEDKAKDAMMDKAEDAAMEKVEDAAMEKAEDSMMAKGADSMKEKATEMAVDKAKGMAKDKVLGTAGASAGVAGKAEHMMKEKAMDHAMDKAEGKMMEHAAGEHKMKEGAVMATPEAAMQEKMSAPAPAPVAAQPVKLLSFDEALAVCRANPTGGLQECIDERTGQGAMRKQMNGS